MTNEAYNSDIDKHGDYVYTNLDDILSSRLANARIHAAMGQYVDYRNKTVIDIGCGDGNFTYELIERGAASVVGIDPAEGAVKRASEIYETIPNLSFECHDVCTMPIPPKKYDIAVLRGVLHHIPNMPEGIRAACQLANEIVVVEPNGYNPVLKIIEKTSAYHIAHKERSFFPSTLRSEFKKNGGVISNAHYVNLVPFFCPDGFAKLLSVVAPLVEAIPLVRQVSCGQYVMHIQVS
jgi:2-polyprenyl-3-methyl-5-hydroxy-6-metoxy-1,4-benzoquinol methylase